MINDITETRFKTIFERVYSINDEINLIIDNNHQKAGFENIVRYSIQMIELLSKDITNDCAEFIELYPDDIKICNDMMKKINDIFNSIINKLDVHLKIKTNMFYL